MAALYFYFISIPKIPINPFIVRGQTAISEVPWEIRGEMVISTVFESLDPRGYKKVWWTLWKYGELPEFGP